MKSSTKPSGSQGQTENAATPAPSRNSVAAIHQREPATRPATTSAAVTAPAPKAPTMKPAQVSGLPYACAEGGESVFTGSEPNPTIATISRHDASDGFS